ncbi:MAG: hypothetical protein JWN86_4130 [Planctomycetota bacterium]|nr:hypothetical protein [Planctomycetota bacterium]
MATSDPVRILIACTMKSGSTFVAKALAEYFGIEAAAPLVYWGRREQNLDPWHFRDRAGAPFIFQMHIKPFVPHVELLTREGVQVVWLRRNLGDTLVSFDDHVARESHENPVGYIHDRGRYLALGRQQRYRYLIRHAIPWYLGFHLMWRGGVSGLSVIPARYEEMVADPPRFFSALIAGAGLPVDEARLQSVLARDIPETRFNQGVNGRSASLFSDETKRCLEEMLLDHPEDLSDLWSELPWRLAEAPVPTDPARPVARKSRHPGQPASLAALI